MNNWVITGHLGRDPDLRQTNSGKDVLNLRVAMKTRVFADGAWTDETEWVDVSMFGTRTQWLGQNLKKGMRVCCAGEMRVRRYTTNQGEARAQVELLAHDIEPLFDRGQQDDQPRTSRPMPNQNRAPGGRPMQDGYTRQGGRPQHRESTGAQYGGAASRGGYGPGYGAGQAGEGFDPDDDIPF